MKSAAYKQILIFIALTYFFSFGLQLAMRRIDDENPAADLLVTAGIFLLMWIPGFVGLALSRGRPGLKVGSFKYHAGAYLLPALTAFLIFLGLALFQIDGFQNPEAKTWWLAIAGFAPAWLAALGEEIGWRGYLQARLEDAGLRRPAWVIGPLWALWHWPPMLWGDAAGTELWVNLGLFTAMILFFSVIIGWLREKSGSVLVAATAHGAHNLWILSVLPGFLRHPETDDFFGGESGLLIVLIYAVMAAVILVIDPRPPIPARNAP